MGSGMDVSGNSNFVVTGNHEPECLVGFSWGMWRGGMEGGIFT